MTRMQVGIAGAGVAGLAVGAALAQAGHQVTVFDQFDTPGPVGSGLVIQPVGQTVLSRLGALDQVAALGQVIDRMIGSIARGDKRVLDVTYDPGAGGAQRHGLAIHRSALFDVLFRAAVAAGVRIETSHRVTGVTDDPRRRLCFDAGAVSTGFDLVIDATGAGSPLSPLRPIALPYGAVWGTVPWPRDTTLPMTQLTQRYVAARHMVGVLPVGTPPVAEGPQAAIFWSLPRAGWEAWRGLPLEDWKARAAAIWPDFVPFLSSIQSHADLTPAFYNHGTLRDPVRRGLVHIGDAAHQASPQLGQGANMALLDAWSLAQAVQTHSTDLTQALSAYHRSRRMHLGIYQMFSRVLTPMYQSDSRVLPVLRDHILTPMTRLGVMQALLARLVSGDLVRPIRGPFSL